MSNWIFSCNKSINGFDKIKGHESTSHGISLLAYTIFDRRYPEIELKVSVNNDNELESLHQQLMINWKNKSLGIMLCSFCINGKYESSYDGVSLKLDSKRPINDVDFKGKKIVLHVKNTTINDIKTYTYSMWYPREINPRQLIITSIYTDLDQMLEEIYKLEI